MREYPECIVPHADHGDPECCGIILPVPRGDLADLICTECAKVLRTVPTRDARQVLAQMASTDTITSHTCPHCGELNAFPGFSVMFAYVCRHCGKGVTVEPPEA